MNRIGKVLAFGAGAYFVGSGIENLITLLSSSDSIKSFVDYIDIALGTTTTLGMGFIAFTDYYYSKQIEKEENYNDFWEKFK